MLPTANAVSGVTGVPALTFARPLTPRQLDPSGKRIVADTPGIASRARSRSSAAWRSGVSLVAAGTSSTGGCDAPGELLGTTEGMADDAPGDGDVDGVANARAGSAGCSRPTARPNDPPPTRAIAAATSSGRRMARRYAARKAVGTRAGGRGRTGRVDLVNTGGTMLEIIDLSKRYGKVVALDGASFVARRGRLVGFLGPNGAGKTTAMRCIFGLAVPDRGEVRWDGRPIDRAARLRFGYLPEQRGLYPRMRVGDQLSYFAQHHGLSSHAARQAADGWLERFGLADRAKSKLEDLSHGHQQRVQLATALIHDPELTVLDEPFVGLDPLGTATMSEILTERAKAGVAVLFSSHQP